MDLIRGNKAASDYLDSLGASWSISTITCLDLLAGAGTQRETDDLDVVLSRYRALSPNEDISHRVRHLMKNYARSHGLHPLDALIAATSLEVGLTLASKNRKHFQMIHGLDLEAPDY